jgi:hypothetical protein
MSRFVRSFLRNWKGDEFFTACGLEQGSNYSIHVHMLSTKARPRVLEVYAFPNVRIEIAMIDTCRMIFSRLWMTRGPRFGNLSNYHHAPRNDRKLILVKMPNRHLSFIVLARCTCVFKSMKNRTSECARNNYARLTCQSLDTASCRVEPTAISVSVQAPV